MADPQDSLGGEPPEQESGLVQCEITGKWVPEDEIVEFQGRMVCAEGKELLLERLRSGELLPGEMETPSIGKRFGCLFVDGLVLGVVSIVIGAGLLSIGPFVSALVRGIPNRDVT